eukprot:jgi/Chlat1/2866/Chrsp195S03017
MPELAAAAAARRKRVRKPESEAVPVRQQRHRHLQRSSSFYAATKAAAPSSSSLSSSTAAEARAGFLGRAAAAIAAASPPVAAFLGLQLWELSLQHDFAGKLRSCLPRLCGFCHTPLLPGINCTAQPSARRIDSAKDDATARKPHIARGRTDVKRPVLVCKCTVCGRTTVVAGTLAGLTRVLQAAGVQLPQQSQPTSVPAAAAEEEEDKQPTAAAEAATEPQRNQMPEPGATTAAGTPEQQQHQHQQQQQPRVPHCTADEPTLHTPTPTDDVEAVTPVVDAEADANMVGEEQQTAAQQLEGGSGAALESVTADTHVLRGEDVEDLNDVQSAMEPQPILPPLSPLPPLTTAAVRPPPPPPPPPPPQLSPAQRTPVPAAPRASLPTPPVTSGDDDVGGRKRKRNKGKRPSLRDLAAAELRRSLP